MSKSDVNLLKSLQEWLSYLESLHPAEIEMGLERILQVYRRMKLRFDGAKIISVGGTNGKGTTVATLEALLIAKSRRVGAYTSPHILNFNERIRINGVDVTDEQLLSAFEAVEVARKLTPLTYFEFGTLAALFLFSQSALDYVLLEVGLGGRLDAVNIVDSDISIITSVDIDHTEWLGSNREDIGYEKAGILRSGGKAVYGELNPPGSVVQQARAQQVDIRFYGIDFGYSDAKKELFYQKPDGASCQCAHISGDIPVSNQLCAVQALEMLGESIANDKLSDALSSVRLSGRMEVLCRAPLVMVDVAHNPHAATYLAKRLKKIIQPNTQVICVFSMLADKDILGVIQSLKTIVDSWIVFPLTVSRAAGVSQMEDLLLAENRQYEVAPSVSNAIQAAKRMALASENSLVIVCGSFYTVAAVKQNMDLLNG